MVWVRWVTFPSMRTSMWWFSIITPSVTYMLRRLASRIGRAIPFMRVSGLMRWVSTLFTAGAVFSLLRAALGLIAFVVTVSAAAISIWVLWWLVLASQLLMDPLFFQYINGYMTIKHYSLVVI